MSIEAIKASLQTIGDGEYGHKGIRYLTPHDRLVELLLAFHSNNGQANEAWPSLRTLARYTGTSRSHVQESILRLTHYGRITRQERYDASGRQTSNIYRIAGIGEGPAGRAVEGLPGRADPAEWAGEDDDLSAREGPAEWAHQPEWAGEGPAEWAGRASQGGPLDRYSIGTLDPELDPNSLSNNVYIDRSSSSRSTTDLSMYRTNPRSSLAAPSVAARSASTNNEIDEDEKTEMDPNSTSSPIRDGSITLSSSLGDQVQPDAETRGSVLPPISPGPPAPQGAPGQVPPEGAPLALAAPVGDNGTMMSDALMANATPTTEPSSARSGTMEPDAIAPMAPQNARQVPYEGRETALPAGSVSQATPAQTGPKTPSLAANQQALQDIYRAYAGSRGVNLSQVTLDEKHNLRVLVGEFGADNVLEAATRVSFITKHVSTDFVDQLLREARSWGVSQAEWWEKRQSRNRQAPPKETGPRPFQEIGYDWKSLSPPPLPPQTPRDPPLSMQKPRLPKDKPT